MKGVEDVLKLLDSSIQYCKLILRYSKFLLYIDERSDMWSVWTTQIHVKCVFDL